MERHRISNEDVLVVDDELLICKLVGEVLTAEGCRPVLCNHPQEALRAARHQGFDLAFIDINLPEMTGIDLASKIKDQSPLCEVVMMTGFASIDNAIQAIRLGVTDYLRKPFGAGEIVFCVQKLRERNALRRRIRIAEERYFRLVQNLPLLIFRLHRDLRLDFMNQACHSLLGYASQEVEYSVDWLVERIHADDRQRVRDLLHTALESDRVSLPAECRLFHKEDRLVYGLMKCISYSGRATEAEDECVEGIVVDITDRVLLEKTLVQREKLNTLGAIAAEVAHEIRNPLVSIGGFARRLKKKLPDAVEAGIILRESERLERILGRIRDYLAPVEIHAGECSINAIVTDCVDLLSPEMHQKMLNCSMELSRELSMATVDPDILREVCINLIRNAIAAMPPRGELLIRTFETDQNLHIDFKNELGGTRLKKPEELFLPLHEGGESIGLPLSYRLLKKMGGLLSFEQSENQVVFTISLLKSPQTPAGTETEPRSLELVD
jgi:PAS domain S-box-containing protein